MVHTVICQGIFAAVVVRDSVGTLVMRREARADGSSMMDDCAQPRARSKQVNERGHRLWQTCRWAYVFAVFTVVPMAVVGAARAPRPLRAEPQALQDAPPQLIERLKRDSFAYFRFVNRPWIARVCDDLGADHDSPIVRLHGDAHVEQFAIAKDA